jgi:diaminopimelate decarboxylase
MQADSSGRDSSERDRLLSDIAERFGTPTYVYDLGEVSRQLGRLKLALPGALIYYAVKANPAGAVMGHLARQGLGAEVITLGELARALRAGFPAERVILGGPAQPEAMRAQAREAGVALVSLDSPSQLQAWEAQGSAEDGGTRFLLRLNPGLDPGTHEHLATGAAESKFGMPFDTVAELAEGLAERGRLAGFHVHAGSQIEEVGIYDDILGQLRELYQAYGEAKLLDIGGGFAVPGFPLEAFATRVRGFAKSFGLTLMIEPGRYLVAQAGVLLTRVLHVKDGPVTHVIADAGMAELIRPALYRAEHPIRLIAADAEDAKDRPQTVVDIDGPLCENADRLGRGLSLPRPRAGDLLAVEQAGAYGLGMSSNYASSLRPAEVVILGGEVRGEVRLARARETVEDLLALEVAPEVAPQAES